LHPVTEWVLRTIFAAFVRRANMLFSPKVGFRRLFLRLLIAQALARALRVWVGPRLHEYALRHGRGVENATGARGQ